MKIYLTYPARFNVESEGFFVEFQDLKGCLTEGNNLEHAKEMAKEALSLYLDVLNDEGQDFPEPSKLSGDNIYYITGELGTSTTYS